jgi:hypothetical protein
MNLPKFAIVNALKTGRSDASLVNRGAGDRGRTGDVQLGNPPNSGNDEEPEG